MTEQARNQRVRKTNKIGVSGVTVDNRRIPEKRYRVTFQVNGKYTIIGNFGTVEEAIEARKQAELKYWGYTKIV